MTLTTFIRTLLVLSALASAAAQSAERPKIGLALSGGGARGAAHIGVLRELERRRVPIDYIAGTSIGAIVGGMYASGLDTDAIEKVLVETDWDDIFKDQAPRRDAAMRRKFDDEVFQINKEIGVSDGKLKLPSGFIQGQKLQLLLDKLFAPVAAVTDFDDLPIPFRAVATDITTSGAVVLGEGSLAVAVRASMSVPPVFATVHADDRILVDGGISNNLPIDVVRNMGADIVIAVNIGTPLLDRTELDSLIGVSVQLTNILVSRTTDAQIATLGERDILITPELQGFSSANFKEAAEIIPNGMEAALAVGDRLAPLGLSPENYAAYRGGRHEPDRSLPVVHFIRIDNDSALADDYIRRRLSQKLDEPIDFEKLEADIGTIYGLEIFQSVNYSVIEESGETGLLVSARQKTWGPRYLQFGARYSSDLSDNNDLALTLGYTKTPLNIWNGEWRSIMQLGEEPGVATELNQPLGIDSPYYVNGQLSYITERFNIFDDGIKVNQFRARTFAATAALGREFGHWGDLRLGLTRSFSRNKAEFGPSSEQTTDVDGGELFALLRVDTLDDAFFPTSGLRGSAYWASSRSALGADNEFDQARLDALGVASWRRHTFLLGGRYAVTLDGEAPIQDRYRMGGLFNLPGFIDNELSGQNLYLLRAGYQRRIGNLFNTSPYLGFTLQYGQVFEDEADIDLADGITAAGAWLGWRSFVGPLYLGYGYAETGDQSIYVRVGSPF